MLLRAQLKPHFVANALIPDLRVCCVTHVGHFEGFRFYRKTEKSANLKSKRFLSRLTMHNTKLNRDRNDKNNTHATKPQGYD